MGDIFTFAHWACEISEPFGSDGLLREAAAYYKPLFEDDNEDIGLENAYL
jgi:hypothetical protein